MNLMKEKSLYLFPNLRYAQCALHNPKLPERRVYSASCVLIMHPYCLSFTEVKTAKAHENRIIMQGVAEMSLEEEEWHVIWVQLVD